MLDARGKSSRSPDVPWQSHLPSHEDPCLHFRIANKAFPPISPVKVQSEQSCTNILLLFFFLLLLTGALTVTEDHLPCIRTKCFTSVISTSQDSATTATISSGRRCQYCHVRANCGK